MWESFAPASCLPDRCFCEAVREGWVRQPANTLSSLLFCASAGVMLWERRRGAFAACFGASVFLVGVTSALFHASLSFVGQTLDVQSMYLLVLAVVALNLDDLRPGRPRRFVPTYLASNLVLGALLLGVPQLRRFAFALAVALIGLTEVLLRRRGLRGWPLGPLLGAAGVQAVAFGVWVLDLTHALCAPQSLWQGHAVWHALGAVATLLLWRYFRPAAPR